MQVEYKKLINKNNLEKGLDDNRPGDNPETDYVIVEKILSYYKVLKENQVDLPAPYEVGGEWKVYIEQRGGIYRRLLDGDIEYAVDVFRNFWRNELGPIVSQYAYYTDIVNNKEPRKGRFIDSICRDYQVWKELMRSNSEELTVPMIGNPWGSYFDNVLVTPQALRFHAHAKQILSILSDINRPVVCGIGNGYGGTAYYLFKLGTNMTYVDFDIPETIIIASYYLMKAFPDKKFLLFEPGVDLSIKNISKYDIVLLPNYAISSLESLSADLFLNAFSLSEMPYETVEEYIRQIERCCKGYFLHNNVDRAGVVNRGYERIPCSRYPIDPKIFKNIYVKYDTFQGHGGDYRECLYERICNA